MDRPTKRKRIRNVVITQKVRFDWGMQFLVFVNFSLLVITASDKLRGILPFHLGTNQLLIVMIPLAFIGTWLFGFFLDVVVKFPQQQMNVINERNPYIMELVANTRKIHKDQKDIKQRIRELEGLINGHYK